jgi:circadian clock protein KaiC
MSLDRLPDALATGSLEETAPLRPGTVSTGMQWLDIILRGGLPENRVYLITGDPGTGKTTLGLQFLLEGVRLQEKSLLITLAENREELVSTYQTHDMDLSGIEIYEVSAAENDRPEEDYTALHPDEVELGESLSRIIDVVEKVKPQRVVVDSLTEIRLMARENVRYRRQLIALKNYLTKAGCTVYFIDDPATRTGSDSQLQTICHGVIQMERLAPEYGAQRRRLQVLKMRGVDFHGGYHDYTIMKGGLVVWPRLVAGKHRRTYEMLPVPSGVARLDGMMGGGPDRGTTMLAVGPAGVGKSSMCQQYCAAAAKRGEYFAWFSFDERLETVYKRADSMGHNFRDLMLEKRCSLQQVDPGSLSPGEFIQRVRQQVERFDARIVVIDSLNGYLTAMPGERFLIIQMHELLNYMSQMGVLSLIIIAQHGLVGQQVDPPIDLSYLADTVTLLRYFEYDGEVRRAISVMKKRGAEHEQVVREFKLAPTGIDVGEALRGFTGILSGMPSYNGAVIDPSPSRKDDAERR